MRLLPRSRRVALTVFIVVMVAILAVGFYRAATHQEARPDTAPAAAASSPTSP